MTKNNTSQQEMDKIRELYNLRMNDINRKPDGKRISTMLYPYPVAELGKPLVDGDMMDLKGNIHRLSDFKGKFVLIDFWTTNCGPCIAALPEIEKFVKRNSDVEVISLCLSQYNSWRTHPSYQNIPWHNMNDGGGWMGLAKSYNVYSVPTYVLISPDGIFIKQWRGEEIFDEGGTLEKFISQHKVQQ
jgi:thiol-disulfide isomerase/thioredoxin